MVVIRDANGIEDIECVGRLMAEQPHNSAELMKAMDEMKEAGKEYLYWLQAYSEAQVRVVRLAGDVGQTAVEIARTIETFQAEH